MNYRTWIAGILITTATQGATGLQNASFEEADRSYMQAREQIGPADRLLPGWEVSIGDGGNTYYHGGMGFYGNVMVYDNAARERDEQVPDYEGVTTLPIAGDVAVGVIPNALYDIHGQLPPPPYLEQSSLVPVGTRSLWFLWQGERLDLRINGDLVPFSLAEQRLTDDPFVPIHDYYAADISQYAGQETSIRFEFYAHEVHAEVPWPGAVQALDDIYFSSIPEPGTLALFTLGAGWLLLTARSAKRRRRSS